VLHGWVSQVIRYKEDPLDSIIVDKFGPIDCHKGLPQSSFGISNDKTAANHQTHKTPIGYALAISFVLGTIFGTSSRT